MARFYRHYLATGKESEESQSKAGRYNPALTIEFTGKTFVLDAGHGDDLSFWSRTEDGKHLLYVLSINTGLPYVGLQTLDLKADQQFKDDDFFLQTGLDEFFGKGWEDKNQKSILNKILEWHDACG